VTAVVSTALSRRLRLAAPVLAVGVVAAGVTVPRLADAADASAALPPRTAAQLLEDVSQADVDGLSGTVVATSRPRAARAAVRRRGRQRRLAPRAAVRVDDRVGLKAGDDRSRVAVRAPWAQYEVVRDGQDVWTYDSASSDVTHLVLPEGTEQPPTDPAVTATPQDLAERLLSSVEPTTTVTVGGPRRWPGGRRTSWCWSRRTTRTLVDEVRIAVDGETSVPLRVQAFGDGPAEPAVEVAFTDVDFSVPDESSSASPRRRARPSRSARSPTSGRRRRPDTTAPAPSALPQVWNEGWSTVVETSGVELPESAQGMSSSSPRRPRAAAPSPARC
jgi:outer membrane lipoprotein-sorting protein